MSENLQLQRRRETSRTVVEEGRQFYSDKAVKIKKERDEENPDRLV